MRNGKLRSTVQRESLPESYRRGWEIAVKKMEKSFNKKLVLDKKGKLH